MNVRRHGKAQAPLAALAALALSGCGGGGGAAEPRLKADTASPPKTVPVTVAEIGRRPVERTVEVVGTLKGWEQVSVGTKKEGRVRKVFHDIGDRVKPGDRLVEFETADADLAVRQADRQLLAELAKIGLTEIPKGDFDVSTLPTVVSSRAKLDKARQLLGRERSLIQRNAGTMQDFQNAENDEKAADADLASAVLNARATLASAQAARVRLEVALHDRRELDVLAPFPSFAPEGVTDEVVYAVSKRSVSSGQFCRVGDPVVELVIEKPLRFWANVPERHSGRIQVGQPVRVTTSAFSESVFEGKVARINPSVDADSRTFQVEAVVPNNRGLLRPGGFAKASVVVDRNSEATVVPTESVVKFAGVTKVFVVEGGKARAVPVETRLEGNGWVEVDGAVPAGGRVVVTGITQLAEGTPVTVVPGLAAKDKPAGVRAKTR